MDMDSDNQLVSPKNTFEEESPVSDTLRYLMEKSGKTVREVSDETGIPYQTLHSMTKRARGANIRTLKLLADYFDEDISIFCGYRTYTPSLRLSPEERELIVLYRLLTDRAKIRIEENLHDMIENPKNLR